jgi:hypothetical protein
MGAGVEGADGAASGRKPVWAGAGGGDAGELPAERAVEGLGGIAAAGSGREVSFT